MILKTARCLTFFLAFSTGYLLVILFGPPDWAQWLKPFLLPPLLAAVYFNTDFPTKKMLLTALFFSWIGDIVLIFAPIGPWYFIGGLSSFLTAHVVYLLLFRQEQKGLEATRSGITQIGLWCIAVFLVAMLTVLVPHLGTMTVPVCLYAATICAMLTMALLGFSKWPSPAKHWILAGAILFVSSDTILAFNKFHHPLWLASFFIMLTYLAAQYALTVGVLALQKKA